MMYYWLCSCCQHYRLLCPKTPTALLPSLVNILMDKVCFLFEIRFLFFLIHYYQNGLIFSFKYHPHPHTANISLPALFNFFEKCNILNKFKLFWNIIYQWQDSSSADIMLEISGETLVRRECWMIRCWWAGSWYYLTWIPPHSHSRQSEVASNICYDNL